MASLHHIGHYCRILLGWAAMLATTTPHAAAVSADPIPAAPYRAPYIPASDDEILQAVPAAKDPAVRKMAELREQLTADPTDLTVAEALARAYLAFGRRVGDAHYAGYAEAVLAPWMAKATPPASVMILQATILQVRHQFPAARKLLQDALKSQRRNAQGWLTLATLEMVQGNYTAAEADCGEIGRTGELFLGMACGGNLRSYTGQARQSITVLSLLETNASSADAEFQAWLQGMLAESCERVGDWPQAEAHYRKALAYKPDDNFLLVAYADLLLDRKRPAEVLKLFVSNTQSDTGFLRLALARAALGTPDAPQYAWIMAARFEALKQRGSDYFGREQARFALHLQHDARSALELAQRNWEVQREPWDARVLLEAAQAAGKPEAAAPVLAFLRDTRLEDPIILALARDLQAQLHGTAVAQ